MGRNAPLTFWDRHDPYEFLTRLLLVVAFVGVVWGTAKIVGFP